MLTSSGFDVLEAESGEQAERLAATHAGKIDLLLTVIMPGKSGRETARHICGNESKPQVVYMSGYPNDTVARHGVLEPGISLLEKPFSPAQLVGTIRKVLQLPVIESPPEAA